MLGRGRCNDRNGYEEGAEILEHDCLTELIHSMQLLSETSLTPLFPVRLPIVPSRYAPGLHRIPNNPFGVMVVFVMLEQAHPGVSEIDPKNYRSHECRACRSHQRRCRRRLAWRGLLHGQSVAPITSQRIAEEQAGRRAYHVDAIALIILSHVLCWFVILNPPYLDVRRRTPEHENAVLPIAPDGAVDDAAKAVLKETSTPLWTAPSMVLFSMVAVAPRFTATPKKPPVTVKPLMVTSRPRT